MKKSPRTFRGADGTLWKIEVRAPGASNAMVVFHYPDGQSSRLDRYAWIQSNGPESRDVTSRLDKAKVLESLTDATLATLFRRSMSISTPVPAVEPG